jgi:hypothetical protein
MCVWHGRVGLHCNCSIRSGLALRQYELLMLPCLRSCCGLEQMVRSFVAKYWAVGSTQPFLPAPAHQPNLLSPWTCFALQIPTQQASPNFPPCRFLASLWARPVSSVGSSGVHLGIESGSVLHPVRTKTTSLPSLTATFSFPMPSTKLSPRLSPCHCLD